MHLEVRPAPIMGLLSRIAAALVAANLLAIVLRDVLHHDFAYGFVPLFDMNQEQNLPTLFSCLLLGLCATLAASLWAAAPARDLRWLILALVLGFMGVDEFVSLHERLTHPLRERLGTGGPLYYAWVLPYGLLCAAFAAAYLPFLRERPRPVRRLLLLSGSAYVAGALGMELMGGAYADAHRVHDLTYALIATAEESLEIGGLLLLTAALLRQITHRDGLHMTIPSREATKPAWPRGASTRRFWARRRPAPRPCTKARRG